MWVFYFAIARRLHGVRSLGLEPRTFRLRVGCSNQLSYERLAHIVPAMWVFYFALRCHTRKRTSGQGRTDAGRFLRPLPLPLGYRSMAHIAGPMWVFFLQIGAPGATRECLESDSNRHCTGFEPVFSTVGIPKQSGQDYRTIVVHGICKRFTPIACYISKRSYHLHTIDSK